MARNTIEAQESARPKYHFTSPKNWINDPNGLIFYKGYYHLFYQHNPFANEWGHMTWGHARSKDLLSWEHLPIAIPEQEDHMIFSGCVVYDSLNTSGLGLDNKGPLIAVYTAHKQGNQSQHIAYSNDGGNAWTFYTKNPILDIKKVDFRDPSIIWHETSKRWVMVIALPTEHKVHFYSSKNLIKWEFLNDFGGHPSFKKIWECPSLIELPVANLKDTKKWVLMISTGGDYSDMRYFTGEFNGKQFKCDHALDQVRFVDYGKDYYAAIPFMQAPKHRAITIGWFNNWAYAGANPTEGWKGMMSMPRDLGLIKETDGSFRLLQTPSIEMENLRTKKYILDRTPLQGDVDWEMPNTHAREYNITIDSHKGCTIEMDFGNKAKLFLQWDVLKSSLCLDRTNKALAFNDKYSSIDCAKISNSHSLQLRIYLDKYSIEVFTADGKSTLSSLFFAPNDLQRFRFISKQGSVSGVAYDLD